MESNEKSAAASACRERSPNSDFQDNLSHSLCDLFVADSHCEALPCLIVHSCIMSQVYNNLTLLFAPASTSSNNGDDQPLVSKGADASVVFALRFLWKV